MNRSTQKALDRLLSKMERTARRPRRSVPTSPFVLGLGLIVGNLLLVRFVPMVWASFLPGGLDSAPRLRGWPGLVWNLAVFCYARQPTVYLGIGAVVVATLLVGTWLRPVRWITWIGALTVIALDAGILFIAMRTSYAATIEQSGLDIGLG